MENIICALNQLGRVDVAFFIICAVIIALIVAVYFLIPVFNKKLYQEQRDNLRKREVAFKSNLRHAHGEEQKAPDEASAEKSAQEETQNDGDSSDQ